MDNAFCGGGDSNIGLSNTAVPISAAALNQIKAVIFMGNPRYRAGLPYNVGTCSAQGVGAFHTISLYNILIYTVRTKTSWIRLSISKQSKELLRRSRSILLHWQ